MKYLGIDFGLRRIGLAISEGELASSLTTVEVKNFQDAVEKISYLVKNQQFTKIVVGLPEGKLGQTVLGFVRALQKKGLDVETADETLSSQRATQLMIEIGTTKKLRRVNDAHSAAIILQNYLDSL